MGFYCISYTLGTFVDLNVTYNVFIRRDNMLKPSIFKDKIVCPVCGEVFDHMDSNNGGITCGSEKCNEKLGL